MSSIRTYFSVDSTCGRSSPSSNLFLNLCESNSQFSRVLVAVQSFTRRSPLIFLPLTRAGVLMHNAREKAMRSSALGSSSSVASKRVGAILRACRREPSCMQRNTARASHCSNDGGNESFVTGPFSPPPLDPSSSLWQGWRRWCC
jgi:hypothetical protein